MAMTEMEATAIVQKEASAFITASGCKKWTQEAHVALVVRIVASQPDGVERKQNLVALLSIKGLGGNASQFRQWLELKDVALLAAAEKAASKYADFI